MNRVALLREERNLRKLLSGQVIERFTRRKGGELTIWFSTGKRMYINCLSEDELGFSVENFVFPRSSSVKKLKKRRVS